MATPVVRREATRIWRGSLESWSVSLSADTALSPLQGSSSGCAAATTSSSGCTMVRSPLLSELTCQERLEARLEQSSAEAVPSLHMAPHPATPQLHSLKTRSPSLQPPATPCTKVYRFGTPMSSLATMSSQSWSLHCAPAPPSAHTSPVSTPRCSVLSTSNAPPTSPPLGCPSPRLLQGVHPCAVKLTGSVRLLGNSITPLRNSQPALTSPAKTVPPSDCATVTPARPEPSAASGHQEAGTRFNFKRPPPSPLRPASSHSAKPSSGGAWQRELSFADLLPMQLDSRAGDSQGVSASPQRPCAAVVAPEAPALEVEVELAAEMAMTPRKRPRKSHAPLRATACGEQPPAPAAVMQQSGPAPALLKRHGAGGPEGC